MTVYASICTTDCTTSCCSIEQAGSNIQALQWTSETVLTPATYFPSLSSTTSVTVTFSGCIITTLASTSSNCLNYVKPAITDAGLVSASQLLDSYMVYNRKYVCSFTITCT